MVMCTNSAILEAQHYGGHDLDWKQQLPPLLAAIVDEFPAVDVHVFLKKTEMQTQIMSNMFSNIIEIEYLPTFSLKLAQL